MLRPEQISPLHHRPVTSLGHQVGWRVFWGGENFLNYVQIFFQRGRKILGGPAFLWLCHCLQDRFINVLQLCIPPNIVKSNQATETVILTYVSTHNLWLYMQRNVENSAIFFQAFHSVICNFTSSSSQCFESQLFQVCRWCWVFTELTWNLSLRLKATWAKSFLMLLAYCKQIIQNQLKTVKRAVIINVSWRKSSCELFPLSPLTPK